MNPRSQPLVCLSVSLCGVAVLLLTLGVPCLAAEVYHWTDGAGTEHYASEPAPGAERLDIEPLQVEGFEPPPPPDIGTDSRTTNQARLPKYHVTLENLHEGESVWNDQRDLLLNFNIQPALAVQKGHRLIVYLDGKPKTGKMKGHRVMLHRMNRGAHEIEARIVDRSGKTLAKSDRVTIYHRQHSLGSSDNTSRP